MYRIELYYETRKNAARAIEYYKSVVEHSTDARKIADAVTVACGAYGAAWEALHDAPWPQDEGGYWPGLEREEEIVDELQDKVDFMIDVANIKIGREYNYFEKFWR